jgi:hypothetical protein
MEAVGARSSDPAGRWAVAPRGEPPRETHALKYDTELAFVTSLRKKIEADAKRIHGEARVRNVADWALFLTAILASTSIVLGIDGPVGEGFTLARVGGMVVVCANVLERRLGLAHAVREKMQDVAELNALVREMGMIELQLYSCEASERRGILAGLIARVVSIWKKCDEVEVDDTAYIPSRNCASVSTAALRGDRAHVVIPVAQ